jgi:radical SAM superfamily enzyme YgiQ (UPF0313 family)
MKILLVLPAAEHLRVTNDVSNVPKRTMLRFSLLPLTTVAALTPSGHQICLCDENVEPLDFGGGYDLVGISFMTALAPRAYQIATTFQKRGSIVVAGGYHPTFLPDEVAKHFDAVVVGDAEKLWPQLVNDAERGQLKQIYRHSSSPSLDNNPLPRRDLLRKTARHYATTDAVQIGRGCIHNCSYCSVTAFHCGTYRRRPLGSALGELKQIGRNFIFVDDNIIAEPEYAKELFRAMIQLKKRWVSQAPITIADDQELLSLARKAGCQGLFVGIETTNPDNLAAVEKNFNAPEDYLKRIQKIRKSGIGIIAGIIVGMDQDSTEVFAHTLKFLLKAQIDALQLNILTPLPGTPLFDKFIQSGMINDWNWSHYDYRHVVFNPPGMTKANLQEGADWLIRQFYRLDRIFLRTLRTFFTLGPTQAILSYRLNMTYRYDVLRGKIIGSDPSNSKAGMGCTLFEGEKGYLT